MLAKVAMIALLAGLPIVAQADRNTREPRERDQSRERKEARKATEPMTGCVDQRGETYRLMPEGRATGGTVLRGRAFSDDNFARYVGHKVSVEGSLEGDTLHVTKITKIAETCH